LKGLGVSPLICPPLVAPLRHLPNVRAVNSSRTWEPIPCRGPIRGLTAPARQPARNCRAEQYWLRPF